jgi:hypothetical protein
MILIFGPFSMQIGIILCTRAKSRLSICSGLIGTSLKRRRTLVQPSLKLFLLVEHHGIKDVMELKYDWNDEVILQFYSTLYLDKKSNTLFWMTEDEIYSVSLIRFTAILGIKDHTHYPKKLHVDHVMELNWMHFMYEKDEYKLSKLEGFKPFFLVLHRILQNTLSPREGDSSSVPQYERNILHAISEEGRFNVFDFIFQEI